MRILCMLFFVLPSLIVSGQDSAVFKPVLNDFLKIDSIKHKTDSISSKQIQQYEKKLSNLKHKTDSLQSRGLAIGDYQMKVDSIQQKISNLQPLTEFGQRSNAGQTRISNKISVRQDSIQIKLNKSIVGFQQKVDQKKSLLDSAGINFKNPIGNLNLPQGKMPGLPIAQLPTVNSSLPSINPSLNTNSFPLPSLKEVPNLKESNQFTNGIKEIDKQAAKEISTVTKEVQGVKEGAKELNEAKSKVKDAKSELKNATLDKKKLKEMEKKTEKDLEKKAMEIKEVKELQQKNPLEQYKEMLSQIKKEKGSISGLDIKKEMPDPFVGKEEKLKAGITELDKLKKKYVTIADSRYLPKRIPNQMKGKPFKERFIPALGFQLHDGSKVGIDLMPYFMYKVSGRLRLGAGFDYRLVSDNQTLIASAQVFGFRTLADFRVYGTWYFHLEGEWLHFDRGSANSPRFPSDPETKEWGDRLNVGVLRTYKISRRFNGMFEALYYAGDWKSFPQTKNSAIRFGFEYKLGEKKKSPAMK